MVLDITSHPGCHIKCPHSSAEQICCSGGRPAASCRRCNISQTFSSVFLLSGLRIPLHFGAHSCLFGSRVFLWAFGTFIDPSGTPNALLCVAVREPPAAPAGTDRGWGSEYQDEELRSGFQCLSWPTGFAQPRSYSSHLGGQPERMDGPIQNHPHYNSECMRFVPYTKAAWPRKHLPLGVEGRKAGTDHIQKQPNHTKSPFNLFQLAVQKYTGNPRYLQSRDLWFQTCTALFAPRSSPAHTAMLQAASAADTRSMCLYRTPSKWPFSSPESMRGRPSQVPHRCTLFNPCG